MKQKHAARIIFFKDKLTHAKRLLQSMNALNIYQLNIFQTLLFMHKVKMDQTPNTFKNIFSELKNKYNTRSCQNNFCKPLCKSKTAQHIITFRGPQLWNNLVPSEYKKSSFQFFKSKIKNLCFNITNEQVFNFELNTPENLFYSFCNFSL